MADAGVLPIDPASVLDRAQQGKSYWHRVWQRLRHDTVTLGVMSVLLILVLMVILAPWFTVHDP
jgi:ABC-type antimicrobial peptide transport system permease subunit